MGVGNGKTYGLRDRGSCFIMIYKERTNEMISIDGREEVWISSISYEWNRISNFTYILHLSMVMVLVDLYM